MIISKKHFIILIFTFLSCKEKEDFKRVEHSESIESSINESVEKIDKLWLLDEKYSHSSEIDYLLLEMNNKIFFNKNHSVMIRVLSVCAYILGSFGEIRNYNTGLKFGNTFCKILGIESPECASVFGKVFGSTSLLTHIALSGRSSMQQSINIFTKSEILEEENSTDRFVKMTKVICFTSIILGGLNFIYPNFVAYDGSIPLTLAMGLPSVLSTSSYLYNFSSITSRDVLNNINSSCNENEEYRSEQSIDSYKEKKNMKLLFTEKLNRIKERDQDLGSSIEEILNVEVSDIDSWEVNTISFKYKKSLIVYSIAGGACSSVVSFLLAKGSFVQFFEWVLGEDNDFCKNEFYIYAYATITTMPWFIMNSKCFYQRTSALIDYVKEKKYSYQEVYDPYKKTSLFVSYAVAALAATPWVYLSWVMMEDSDETVKSIVCSTAFASSIFLRGESFRHLLWDSLGFTCRVFKNKVSSFKNLYKEYELRKVSYKFNNLIDSISKKKRDLLKDWF